MGHRIHRSTYTRSVFRMSCHLSGAFSLLNNFTVRNLTISIHILEMHIFLFLVKPISVCVTA